MRYQHHHTYRIAHRLLLASALLISICVSSAGAQITAFTYQGKLADNGSPANGQYDLEFKLFDTLHIGTGTQQGSTVLVSNVAVTAGIFTVQIDFGVCATCFDGSSRFLELAVKQTNTPTLTTLSPRQPILSTPYAINSQGAAVATTADKLSVTCVNCVTSSQIQNVQGSQITGSIAGSQINGLIPVASVPAGSANYIQNGTNLQAASNFNISGNGTIGGNLTVNGTLNANLPSGSGNYIQNSTSQQPNTNFNISGNGTVGGTLTGTIVSAAHYNIGSSPVLVADAFQGLYVGLNAGSSRMPTFFSCCDTFVGFDAGLKVTTGVSDTLFGSLAGASITDGDNNSFFGESAGVSTTGSANCFFGRHAGQSNTTGTGNITIGHNADVGAGNLTNAIAIGTNAIVAQTNSLVLGGVTGVNGGTTVSVGIGVTAPSFRLHVIDPGNSGLRVETDTTGGTLASFGGFGDFLVDAVNVAGGRFTIQQDGKVGIGANAPLDKLQVLGDIRVGTGTTGCVKDANGTVIAGACSSDVRLKRDITPFPNLLDRIVRLRPVTFYWRTSVHPTQSFGSGRSFGLVAQEVEQVMPEMVTEDEQGYKAVNYSKLPLLILQAVKEQQAQIERQQQDLDAQQKQLQQQQREIDDLRNLVCQTNPQATACKSNRNEKN